LSEKAVLHGEKDLSGRTYVAIDLKSYYASVECVQRGLDPLDTFLAVADISRTEKTICLAVSPALKSLGVPGRPRLFEVVQKVRQINACRRLDAPGYTFTGKTTSLAALKADPGLELDYLVATPQMGKYVTVSAKIYDIYLKYLSPEDIHVYSIDEVFMDVTGYLGLYKATARELAMGMILDVLHTTGITATAGIGSNLYLCKVAMDIVAKHILPDENGVRIVTLDEESYRYLLWEHRPLTDFWRVGPGYAKKLQVMGIYTMGDIALCSVQNPDYLYQMFGINAELLIDHAWGVEPCTMAQIKAYRPSANSISSGQVLHEPYTVERATVVIREMCQELAASLLRRCLVTDRIVLDIGYDRDTLKNPDIARMCGGSITEDGYGRRVPKPLHLSVQLNGFTCSEKEICEKLLQRYRQQVEEMFYIRRINVTAAHVIPESRIEACEKPTQISLFDLQLGQQQQQEARKKENKRQRAVLSIQDKFGKNAILKGADFLDGATARERNEQIGGHKK